MNPRPPSANDRGLVDDALFIAIAYGFAWLCMLVPKPAAARFAILLLGTFAPTIAALVVGAKHGGRAGVVILLKKFLTFRAPFWAYLLAWYLFPAVLFGTFVAFGYSADNASLRDVFEGIVVAAPLNYTVGTLLFGTVGPQGEELGWRGYLLPRWRARFGEAWAPALVGIVWAFWHLPLFLDPAWPSEDVPFVLNLASYVATVIAASYLFAAVYGLAKESLIVVILLHGAFNLSNMMLMGSEGPLHNDGWMQNIVLLVATIISAVVAQALHVFVRRRRLRASAAVVV